MTPLKRLLRNEDGFLMPALITFIIAMGILSGAVLEVVLNNFTVVGNNVKSQRAFNIAEAGVNYYLWHLSHNATDFKDGQNTPATPTTYGYGPYTHNYVDSNGVTEGTYTLYIDPQGSGSTIATIRSIGHVKDSDITRTVQAEIGVPSFASYAVASDSALWFGSTEAADGPVHSNQGVRMDGSSDAEVSSANATYTPSNSVGGCSNSNCSYPGVWCSSTVTLPINCNSRDKSNWVYPVPSLDFNQVSSSLCTMKKVALGDTSNNACSKTPNTRTASYIPQYSSNGSFSTTRGYLIKLNSNGTYDLFKVNSENDQASSYTSALNTTSVATGISIPDSGVIFVEDNVWVLSNPTFHGRVTIASGRLASTTKNTDIVIAGPLQYSTKNGSDAIGLVTEDSIILAPYAPPSPSSGGFNFEVDAALLAENGNVEFPDAYRTNSWRSTPLWDNPNQQFLFYGSISTRQTWTWTWCSGTPCTTISGIANNTTKYDYNLHYAPPPSYPITSGYNILSWREVLTRP